MEWKTLCKEMMDKLKSDNRQRAIDLYNGMNPHDANDDSVARGGVKNLMDWKKALERMIKLSEPLEKCSHQEAKLAWRGLMLDVGCWPDDDHLWCQCGMVPWIQAHTIHSTTPLLP